MPVVFSEDGFRFHFFSDEGDPREPVHIHIVKADADAKFWLYPDVNIAYNRGFSARTLNSLSKIVERRKQEIEDAWYVYFN